MPVAIKVGCCFLLSDVYSFNGPSSCVVCLHLLHCGCFPVYLVLCLSCMYSNSILCVILFDCSFRLLAQSFLQRCKKHDLAPELAGLTRSFSHVTHHCGHDSSPPIAIYTITANTYRDRNSALSSIPGSRAHAHAHASCPLSVPSHRPFRHRS